MAILNRLVVDGNSVVVVEHNLAVIVLADWVIDLGPKGAARKDRSSLSEHPERVAEHQGSHTGLFLVQRLQASTA